MQYFTTLAHHGVFNDAPKDFTHAEAITAPKRSDREARLREEMEELEAKYSGTFAPARVIARLDWITGQIEQIQDAELLAAFKGAVKR